MPTVTLNDISYSCTIALKGPDFIHLLNEYGDMIAAFDGVVSFNDFSISDGDWTSPADDNSLPLAVIREDGTRGKADYTPADIDTALSAATSAQQVATVAQEAAASAQALATAAQTSVSEAQTNAADAKTAAGSASTAAATAQQTAEAAQTASNSAVATATAAQTTANAALPAAGGTITGTLTLDGKIILSANSYGSAFPESPTTKQLFMLQV